MGSIADGLLGRAPVADLASDPARARQKILGKHVVCQGFSLVPVRGVEPPRGCPQWILNPSRLPFRHTGKSVFGERIVNN